MKGLVDFERTPERHRALFRVDMARKRPPTTARKAFAAFNTVVEQYPKSDYAHDSLQRMVYLRNRLAEYEVHVARYYFKRGAYIAAAQRAQGRHRAVRRRAGGARGARHPDRVLRPPGLQPNWPPSRREVYAANYSGDARSRSAEAALVGVLAAIPAEAAALQRR